jgi:hypothetical protein
MTYKTCGWNTTHTSEFHDSWAKDPHAFFLPGTRILWTKSGKKPPTGGDGGTTAPATAAQSATTGSIGSATSLLSAHLGRSLLSTRHGQRMDDLPLSWPALKGFKLMGHCIFHWLCNVLTLLLSVFVFCSMATFIHWSLGSGGRLSCWLFDGSQRRKCYHCLRTNHKHSKFWRRQALLFKLIY